MIATQQIKSVTASPKQFEKDGKSYESVNVLRWNYSEWTALCPYVLKTDGKEVNVNPGNVIFENFWQGSKVYDVVYEKDEYPSRYQMGNPKYLYWSFRPETSSGDVLLNSTEVDPITHICSGPINYNLYYRWRNSLWACPHAIRYPNGRKRTVNTKFALVVEKDGKESRLNYIDARKQIYVTEYIRLVKQLPEYKILLYKLKSGTNLLISEIDVPANGKKGLYGRDVDADGNCIMSIEKLEQLMNDPSEAFGHGLALSYALLKDLKA